MHPRAPLPPPAPAALRRRLPAALALVAGVALALVSAAGPGVAAPLASSPPAPTQLWALSPAATNPTQPSTRTTFSYSLGRGASVSDKVIVYNYGDQPAPFRLYATDALDTAEGQFDLLREDQKPSDIGTWVKLLEPSVIVPAHSAEVVPLTVTIPAGATPGDHAGGIVASASTPQTDPTGHQVLVVHRIGVPLYVRVAGPINPALAVLHVVSHYHRSATSLGSGTLDVVYTVKNVGNIRLSAHQKLTVSAPFGIVLKTRKLVDIPELLPGASVTRSVHLTGVLPTVWVSSTVKVTPFSKTSTFKVPLRSASGSSSVWAIPWVWLVLLAAAIGLIYWRRRTRGPRAPRTIAPARTAELEPTG